jgi:hypothetical protein
MVDIPLLEGEDKVDKEDKEDKGEVGSQKSEVVITNH